MIYVCNICGYIFDEEKEGKSFDELEKCPICSIGISNFTLKANSVPTTSPETGTLETGLLEPELSENISVETPSFEVSSSEDVFPEITLDEIMSDENTSSDTESDDSIPPEIFSPRIVSPKIVSPKIVSHEIVPPETTSPETAPPEKISLEYTKAYVRHDENERCMSDIHKMAVSGTSIIEAMGISEAKPSWDEILILGAQLNPMPLDERAFVTTKTVIGKHAKRPMKLDMPMFISHMSFGALSKEVKIALATGSAAVRTAMCSGEGGILPEERAAAYKYIFEYVPNLYSVTTESLKNADAIEIKIGQGTKPGMGGHLPGEKVTEEIAKIRNKPIGQDIISPSTFPGVEKKEDLKRLVNILRELSDGRPIGIKIAAGRIEKDLEFAAFARPDFVTLDGRGGATGASPKLIRNATSVPTIYALHRARKYLDLRNLGIQLIITGGLRVSSDFAKAIAMGADAVAIASAALIAAACQQYKICNSGYCPVGVATQDPELRKRLDVNAAAKRVSQFLSVSNEELKIFARITGHNSIHNLTVEDLCTTSNEISANTNIKHA